MQRGSNWFARVSLYLNVKIMSKCDQIWHILYIIKKTREKFWTSSIFKLSFDFWLNSNEASKAIDNDLDFPKLFSEVKQWLWTFTKGCFKSAKKRFSEVRVIWLTVLQSFWTFKRVWGSFHSWFNVLWEKKSCQKLTFLY